MKPGELTIDFLKHHEEAVPILAKYSYDEWKPVYDRLGASFEDAVADYARRTNTDTLPLALVAICRDQVVGTVSLKTGDLEIRPGLTPWLGGLYVVPEYRDRGIATALIRRLVDEARRLQIKRLHLWTPSAENLYAKLGWVLSEKLRYCDYEISVMQRDL